MLCIKVPATSANIGSGFDALGIALSLYNYVWMEEFDGIKIISRDGSFIPLKANNLIYKSAKQVYNLCGRRFIGLHIEQENNIPMTRGLGSSSACIVAGILGANKILGNPMITEDIVSLAARIEGHPDNSTPAILGGLATAVLDHGRVFSVKVPVSEKIRFVAFIPDFELRTEKARGVLPKDISHSDAVFNLSRSALMVASLFSGQLKNIGIAVQDKLHQPYRLELIPGATDVFNFTARNGAYGTYISGAGPTIISIIDKNDDQFAIMAGEWLMETNPNWKLMVLDCDDNGAMLTSDI